mgnify:CR=1 FL=1
MAYSFACYGHENITARHKTTLEFTKSNELSLKGDCIIGIKADFSLKGIKLFVKSLGNNKKIKITIEKLDYNDDRYTNQDYNKIENNEDNKKIIKNNNLTPIDKNKIKNNTAESKIIEKINAEVNPGFNSSTEMVIRKSGFIDGRTFAIKADKAACDLSRELIKNIVSNKQKTIVSLG